MNTKAAKSLLGVGIVAIMLSVFTGFTQVNASATSGNDCYEQVTEYKYVKETRERSRSATWQYWSNWSAWTVWGNGSTIKWSSQNVEVLESGDHDGNVDDWSTYDRDYRYVNTGVTRVVNGKKIPCPTTTTTTTSTTTTSTTVPTTTTSTTVPTTTTSTTTTLPKKIEICHRDQGNPEWKQIEISENALDAHLSHQWGADLYPVPEGGCPPPPTTTTTSTTSTTTSTTSTTVPTTTSTTVPETTTTSTTVPESTTTTAFVTTTTDPGTTTTVPQSTTTTVAKTPNTVQPVPGATLTCDDIPWVNIPEGDVDYHAELDTDGNGVICEEVTDGLAFTGSSTTWILLFSGLAMASLGGLALFLSRKNELA